MLKNSTISVKEKPCKGMGKAKGHGCGKKVLERTYGLGWCCYPDWLLTTEEGKEKLNKSFIKSNRIREKEERKRWNEKKKELKKSDFEKELQKEINKLARKIDSFCDYKCIDCDKEMMGQIDGAHYIDVGGDCTLRYNLHNIHSARAFCNQRSNEHKKNYPQGLENRYGEKYLEMVNGLQVKYKYLGLTGAEVHEKLTLVRKINREFEDKVSLFTNLNGKEIRDYYNNLIGIYN